MFGKPMQLVIKGLNGRPF